MITTWQDVQARYSELDKLPNVDSATIRDAMLMSAEAAVIGRLASKFTLPFGDTNLTLVDLVVDMVYVQNVMTRQPEKAKLLKESIDERIRALLDGDSVMVDSAGVAVAASIGDTVWSSSENYPPIFGVSDIDLVMVSSQQLYDEAQTRGDML